MTTELMQNGIKLPLRVSSRVSSFSFVMDWKMGGLRWLILVFIALFTPGPATVLGSSSPFASFQSGLYKDTTFAEAVTAFTPYEKIYLLVELQELQTGKYTLITDWLTPWGELEHQSSYSFELKELVPSWKVYSWLNLWKNGPVKRLFTGEDFKKEFYGTWTVRLFLNGKQIHKQNFDMQ